MDNDKIIRNLNLYIGDIYLDKFDYNNAEKAYQKTKDSEGKLHPLALYSCAYIQSRKANYSEEKKILEETESLFTEEKYYKPEEGLYTEADSYYYSGEINTKFFNYNQSYESLKKAENLYLTALEKSREYALPYFYLSLMNVYLMSIRETEHTGGNVIIGSIADCRGKFMNHFRKGTSILKNQIARANNKYDLFWMGEFLLLAEQTSEAIEFYRRAIEADKNFIRAFTGIGIAYTKLENYPDAITNLRKANQLDPDDLFIQCQLARALSRHGMHSAAEDIFLKIQQNVKYYVDGCLGLMELYQLRGDEAFEKEEYESAAEFYEKSFEKFAYFDDKRENNSRELNAEENNNIRYNKGYLLTKLYEINTKGKFPILKRIRITFSKLENAKKQFELIPQNSPIYFRAKHAILKIKQQKPFRQIESEIRSWIIPILGLVVFCIAQIFFLFGRKVIYSPEYSLNPPVLFEFVKTNKLDSLYPEWKGLLVKTFTDSSEIRKAFIAELEAINLPADWLDKMTEKKTKTTEYKKINEGNYALLTFTSLMFIIIGFVLRDITKLKFGSIELEKSTIETVGTSTRLGIESSSKAGSSSVTRPPP